MKSKFNQQSLKKYSLYQELGFIYPVFTGFQFDLNTVLQKTSKGFLEAHWCNNNCTLEYGNYQCPSAFTCNSNIDPQKRLTFGEIKEALLRTKKGLIKTKAFFLKNVFPDYVQKFHIPQDLADFFKQILKNGQLELNLFGGNPELHPDFLKIIRFAKKLGFWVTATTTGKKFLAEPDFLEKFLKDPPHCLALSADDYKDLNELENLLTFSVEKLKTWWQKINPLYGQRKKAYESIYVAKLAQNYSQFPSLLFNLVVHPGNLFYLEKMIKALTKAFPKVMINPYLAQSSFYYGRTVWQKKHLITLNKFIDLMIKKQLEQVDKEKRFVPRLHYWLFLKSVFLSKSERILAELSGWGLWTCYRQKGAGRYLQAGSTNKKINQKQKIGAHPGCFWNNQTITADQKYLWAMNPEEVGKFLLEEKLVLSQKAKKPCPGCLMPRLLFDGINTELGMNQEILPFYLKLRKEYLNF